MLRDCLDALGPSGSLEAADFIAKIIGRDEVLNLVQNPELLIGASDYIQGGVIALEDPVNVLRKTTGKNYEFH